ncbi:MAG: hypothetical protein AAF572_05300 [Cyanobacteria bacterium P01_B01_bin.77]
MGLTIGICIALLLCVWQTLHTLKQGASYVRRLHQIPCSRCAYFTSDYRLKCTVNPVTALTEEAIDCVDYVANAPGYCHLSSQDTSRSWHIKKLINR